MTAEIGLEKAENRAFFANFRHFFQEKSIFFEKSLEKIWIIQKTALSLRYIMVTISE